MLIRHPWRRLPLVLGAGLILAVLWACGTSDPEPMRYAVAERGLGWEAEPEGPVPPPPLVAKWSFDDEPGSAGMDAWMPDPGTLSTVEGGRLVLTGKRRAAVRNRGFDPEIHHWITIQLRSPEAHTLIVEWRRADEPFAKTRSFRQPLPTDRDARTTSTTVALTSLRGAKYPRPPQPGDAPAHKTWDRARDALEGLDQIRLTFEGDSPFLRVELDEVTFVSDYDDRGPGTRRLGRHGEYRHGVVLRTPGALRATLRPGASDRMRFGLALAGTDLPLTIELTEEQGRLPPQRWSLAPGASWLDVSVDLSPLGGEPGRLRLAPLDGSPSAAVLVGSMLRLELRPVGPPPIVLYLEDTLRADHLSVYGHSLPTDPHLRRVARDGVLFERALASSNWTRPATSSILTSLDALTHGNNSHLDRVAESVRTLAEELADAGYLTTSFVTNFHAGDWSGLAQGMDIAREPPSHGAVHVTSTLTSAAIARPLEDFLDEHHDELVFVFVHSVDPHVPYQPPPRDVAALDPVRARSGLPVALASSGSPEASLPYDAEILHNDRQLALLDATLTRLGLVEQTLFVFLSDHGEAFAEHGTYQHRNTLYQEELHIPLLMRWPDRLPGNRRWTDPVSQIDVAPTVLGLVGLTPPLGWQGQDLSPWLLAPETPTPDPVPVLSHVLHADKTRPVQEELAVLWGPHKLIAEITGDGRIQPRSLFQLDDDPGEHQNLIDMPDRRDIIAKLTAWATERVAVDRAASRPAFADEMDPAKRAWMREMGYLGK